MTHFDGSVSAPDMVSIETTRYCNLQCGMCLQYQDGTTVKGPHMDMALFERFANEIFPHITRFQPSVSGEPLMARGLERQLEIAESYGVRTELVSNATLLNAKMRERILPTLGRMIISFDGATKDSFEWIRAGADFDAVVANVRELGRMVAAVPLPHRPILSFGTVLMRKNIEELGDIVRLAKQLGMHYVATSHLHPITEEMRQQSLAHCPELARRCIADAGSVAEEIGLPLIVHPLDQVIVTTALSGVKRRALSTRDGVVEGLEHRIFAGEHIPAFPGIDGTGPQANEIRERRNRATAQSPFLKPVRRPKPPKAARPIQVCDFLWNKTYVALDGNVRMCCVPGTPNMGNMQEQSFAEVWNNDAYRFLRESLVRGEPADICRGCQHIVTVDEPEEMARWLGGRQIPKRSSFQQVPELLDPLRKRRADEVDSPELPGERIPRLAWEEARGVKEYTVELSTDEFRSVEWSSTWHDTLRILGPAFEIPEYLWVQVPIGQKVQWRASAHLPDRAEVVELGRGEFVREAETGG